jgi:crotonobetainyl-CoA:carnitine CoA-transferase CaiB-like acyl-CoA transferase
VREALRSEAGRKLVDRAGDYESLRHPVRVDGKRAPAGKAAPKLGEHTSKILRELGYDAKSVNAMERDGIIARRSTRAATAPRRRR